ncbi:MAG: hypothetical protein K0Q87_5559, partial [Neobacillus sp.]|nr:hypothetical protein [Neobacillus sp.]
MVTPENKLPAVNELPLEKQLELLKKNSISYLGDGEVFVR